MNKKNQRNLNFSGENKTKFIFNKKAELTARKIVVMLIVIIVLVFVIPKNISLFDFVGSGISSFEEQACESEGYQTQDIVFCGEGTSCEKDTKKKWDKYINYLKGKSCGINSYATKDVGIDKKKACTCMQKAIYLAIPKTEQSKDKIDKFVKIGEKEDFTTLNIGNCKFIPGKFDPTQLQGTPYWVTNKGETGKDTFLDNLGQVVTDTSGTKSYGNFGLNSKGGANGFWSEFGSELGLIGTPGTKEAEDSWKKVALEKPNDLLLAQIKWYNQFILEPTVAKLKLEGLNKKYYDDPRIIAYFSDVTIQEGANSRNSLLIGAMPGFISTPSSYLKYLADYQSSDKYLKKKFRTYLSEHPQSLQGLKNRILNVRYPLSKKVTILKIEEIGKVVCS